MSCNPVRIFVSILLLIVAFSCAITSAQTYYTQDNTDINFHIYYWDKNNPVRPNNTDTDFFYPYMQYTPSTQPGQDQFRVYGLRDTISELSTRVYDLEGTQSFHDTVAVNLILHNDDLTLQSAFTTWGDQYNFTGFYYDNVYENVYYTYTYASNVVIKSDKEGFSRTLRPNNSSLIQVASGATLTITKDIIINNTVTPGLTPSNYYYDPGYSGTIVGGIILNTGGKVTVQDANYSNNLNTANSGSGSVISSVASYYYGYYPVYPDDPYYPEYTYGTLMHRGTVNVDGSKFTTNAAMFGGAIYLNESDLHGYRSVFYNNGIAKSPDETITVTTQSGGAVYLKNHSTAILEQSDFSLNKAAQNGGAVYAENSNLYLKGTKFNGNIAGQKGGAIYFDVNDGGVYLLQLGAFRDLSVDHLNNIQHNGQGDAVPNSIVFANSGSNISPTGFIRVEVDVEGKNNNFNMRDPMEVVGYEYRNSAGQRAMMDANLTLHFIKSGEGAWNLYGDSDISHTYNTILDISQGIFQLGDGAKLNMANKGGLDKLNIFKGATFIVGDPGTVDKDTSLLVSNLLLNPDSTFRLNKNLNLDIRDQGIIGGTLTGSGNLVKVFQGDPAQIDKQGVLQFTGKTEGYTGDLDIQSGEFWADSTNSFKTTGSVNFGLGTIFSVTANSNAPNIIAKNINIDNNVIIQINGIADNSENFVVLKSDNEITGNFANNPSMTLDVDYLDASFGFSPNRKEYTGNVKLTWDKDNTSVINGTFTVDPTNGQAEYFKIDTILEDRTTDSKKLTKKGRGTLELAKANEYRGGTAVDAGTLLVTNAKGTGLTGTVDIAKKATLALNFNDNYDRQISGEGQVVKTGNTTLTLTNNTNNYSGGTRIEDGILNIANGSVLGTGTITFDGGVFQSNSNSGEVSLTQNINTETGYDIELNTLSNLRINSSSTMTGEGGLHKTGAAKLTLAGKAAYQGMTVIDQGTLSLTSMDSIGTGKIILADGVVFENMQSIINDRNITLNTATDKTNSHGVIFNVESTWKQTGSIDGNGELVKIGNGTMQLSGINAHSGGTRLQAGTLAFSSASAFGTGSIIFDGGALQNTQKIDNFTQSMEAVNGHSFLLDTQKELTISSRLSGNGGLTKTGDAKLTLLGKNDYFGATLVKNGMLNINGQLTESKVTVESGAALSGSGTIHNNVVFKPGAIYQWNYGIREEESPYLTAKATVNIRSAVFRPVTATPAVQDSYPDVIDGWTVLKYGMLEGNAGFASIDNEFSPFYDFMLDYSTPNEVKIIGYHRRNPRQLSDAVAMGLVIPQRKVYRRAFEQIDREIQNGRYLGLRSVLERRQQQIRGQASPTAGHVWADFYGRFSEYQSRYHTNNNFKFNSFGLQVGYSFLSTNWISLGVTAGVELPTLKNSFDKIDAADGFIGLYAGTRVWDMWELKGYFGGGTQDYKSYRNDTRYTYHANYRGDSFETNIELGRPLLLGPILVRPHFGFDLEYAGQQGSVETKASNEYRSYSNTTLTQVFFRVGLDTEKRTDWGEIFLGIDYANMIAGQSVPHVDVYYPAVKSGTTVYGTSLGQNIFSIRTGANHYLNRARSKSFFFNVMTDIFADRAGGQMQVTATFGLDSRF